MANILRCLCVLAAISGALSSSNDCPALLKQAGASEKFAERVVHAIHAITVNDLKKLEPRATVKNNVPTVNRDKDSPIYVLPNAPDIKSADEDKFNTTTMKLLDLILTHIDDRVYYESDYTLIEQIVHTAHMLDHREQVKVSYDKLKASRQQIDDTDLCACALDTKNNGIHDILVSAAQFARDRRSSNIDQGTLRYSRLDSHTKYSCDSLVGPRRAKRGIIGPLGCAPKPQQLEAKPADPNDCDSPVGKEALTLTGSGAWSLYKKRLHCLEGQTYDSALFLYCALKQV
jgi:hypothetical protein